MKSRGFAFIEILIGVFLLGIISVFSLTTLSMSTNRFNKIRLMDEMNYIGEMVIEKLKIEDSYIEEVLEKVDIFGEANYEDESVDDDKYTVTIFKDSGSEGLLELSVEIFHNYQEREPIYVYFKAAIPK